MTQYRPNIPAEYNPGRLRLSGRKLEPFRRQLGLIRLIERSINYPGMLLDRHLQMGDSRAALVMRTSPEILVAAYTDELDCVVMLRFPQFVRAFYRLEPGTRLLTVNCYSPRLWTMAPRDDLHPSQWDSKRFTNLHPLIAEFLSDDLARIEQRKREIPDEEWHRTTALAEEYMRTEGSRARDGSPYFSACPSR